MKFGDRATAYPGEIPLTDILSGELRERRAKSSTVISGMSHLADPTSANLSHSFHDRVNSGRVDGSSAAHSMP